MVENEILYIWLVPDWSATGGSEGRPAMGTLWDYAEAWKKAYYTHEDLPTELYTYTHLEQGPQKHVASVIRGELDEDDQIPYTISVNGDSVRFRIDGRF